VGTLVSIARMGARSAFKEKKSPAVRCVSRKV
jgi:hypothetical protein